MRTAEPESDDVIRACRVVEFRLAGSLAGLAGLFRGVETIQRLDEAGHDPVAVGLLVRE